MTHASLKMEEDEPWRHYLPCRPISTNNGSHFLSTESDEQLLSVAAAQEVAECTTFHKMTLKNNLLL
jgi:hypothetical protein